MALVLVLAALLSAVGCTPGGSGGGSSPAPSPDGTRTRTTIVGTRTPSSVPFTARPVASVKPLPPGKHAPNGETDKRCPYLRSGLNQGSGGGVNLADIEGDRVGRTTVLTERKPVGCRFYFAYPPYEAIADILPTTFLTATAAHNALVRTARAGTALISEPHFVDRIDGIRYRTKFFGQDGARDWAFAFAKKTVLVVVHTQQNDVSLNALLIGKAIVGKF